MVGKMNIHVISIFPEMFSAITDQGVIGRSIKQGVLSLNVYNPRDYTDDKHKTVDARPYGGGPGMVMMPEPTAAAIKAAKSKATGKPKVVYLSPQGKLFNHQAAQRFAEHESLVLLSGRYEGIDERVIDAYVDEEWSIGDYVLSGGELPVMVVIDAISRLLPDSLGNDESAKQDSFVHGLLDCPHFTRPELWSDSDHKEMNMKVPDVLLSGNHQAIEKWREQQALCRTFLRRPELLEKLSLTDEQHQLLAKLKENDKFKL